MPAVSSFSSSRRSSSMRISTRTSSILFRVPMAITTRTTTPTAAKQPRTIAQITPRDRTRHHVQVQSGCRRFVRAQGFPGSRRGLCDGLTVADDHDVLPEPQQQRDQPIAAADGKYHLQASHVCLNRMGRVVLSNPGGAGTERELHSAFGVRIRSTRKLRQASRSRDHASR